MKLIPNAATRTVARQILELQKGSPRTLFAAGVVGVVGSTVLACRATLKLEEVLTEGQADLERARTLEHRNYSETDRKHDVTVIYMRTAVRVGTLYAPAILLGAASIGSLTMSHHMLNQRNLALTAAYATLDKAFSEYRERVIQKYGEDEDRNFRFKSEEVLVQNERTGEVEKQLRVHPDAKSMYARFFDPLSPNWSEEPEYNLLFLRMQQNYWNDMLKARGHVMLNDVYKSLGLEPTSAGAVVGWILAKGAGDNYIDFGIYDSTDNARDFVNGREGSILLDFNVDGVIFDKLDELRRDERITWQS